MSPHRFPSASIHDFGRISSRESKEILMDAPICIFKTTPDGRILTANQTAARKLGYDTPRELTNSVKDIASEVYADPGVRDELMRLLAEKDKVEDFECRLLRRDGSDLWVSHNLQAIRDRDGNISHFQVFALDITERKQTEGALHQSETYYRAIFETSGSPMLIIEEDTTICLVNSHFEAQLGYARQEVEGEKSWTEFIHPEDVGWMREYHVLRRLKPWTTPHHYEFRFIVRNGEVRHAYLTIDLIPGTTQSVVSFIDITERKQLEERLRANEAFLHGILESIQDGISVLDPELTIRQVNGVMRRWYAAREPLEGQKCYKAFHDRCSPCSQCPSMRCLQSGRLEHEEVAVATDASTQWIELFSYPMKDESQGNVSYVVEFVRDITQRKQAEQALRQSERRYRQEKEYLDNLIQNSADAVVILDEHGRITRWNKQAHLASGYSFQEVRGMHFSRFHTDHEEMEHMLAELREKGSVQGHEISFITQGGRTVPCSISVSIIRDDQDQMLGSINILRDLTEWKRTQQKLEEKSLHDSLTGLYSRSFFEEEMKRLADDRYCPIGLVVSDINGLKLINDTLGHDKGDELIQATGRILKECFRGSDIIARIGGDEFAVLLPESSFAILRTCCQRIREKVTHFTRQHPQLGLSISIGYAVEDRAPADLNTLFKKADDAMYKDKLRDSDSSRSATVQALISSLEVRDHIGEGHAERLSEYVQRLGRSLELSAERLHALHLLAWFHDLGKAGIPDNILFKPSTLTRDEYQEMQRHCEIGHRIALSTSDLAPIADLILKHHEWWDGRGHPLGLAGEDIPLECRILAIADAYETMTSHRPYRSPLSHEEAIKELRRWAGTQFDPKLVERFIRIAQE
jgi:diguanylate cyclase (GGDEF)-like protein/PAS domain S-box-containing protein